MSRFHSASFAVTSCLIQGPNFVCRAYRSHYVTGRLVLHTKLYASARLRNFNKPGETYVLLRRVHPSKAYPVPYTISATNGPLCCLLDTVTILRLNPTLIYHRREAIGITNGEINSSTKQFAIFVVH